MYNYGKIKKNYEEKKNFLNQYEKNIAGIALQAKKDKIPHFSISPLEHSSVRDTAFFLEKYKKIELSLLPIDKTGIVKLEDIEKLIKKNTQLISIATASSEIGTKPIPEITSLAKQMNIFFPYGCCAICSMGLNLKKFSRAVTRFFSKIYGQRKNRL